MKLAVLIQCHKNPEQVNRLITAMSHEEVSFYVHVDRKSRIGEQILRRKDIHLLPEELRVDVQWSRISQVDATLNLLRYARRHGPYDFYWVISGQDYPIKPVEEILDWFAADPVGDFLELFPSRNHQLGRENNYDKRNAIFFPEWMLGDALAKRLAKRAWVELTGGYGRTWRLFRRKTPGKLNFYFGSSWICLAERTLGWILGYLAEHPEYYRFFVNCNCPDESFFQTLVMGSPYRESRRDYLHYVDWSEGKSRPKTLALADFDALRESPMLMARKFDLDTGPDLMDKIDRELLGQPVDSRGTT